LTETYLDSRFTEKFVVPHDNDSGVYKTNYKPSVHLLATSVSGIWCWTDNFYGMLASWKCLKQN